MREEGFKGKEGKGRGIRKKRKGEEENREEGNGRRGENVEG